MRDNSIYTFLLLLPGQIPDQITPEDLRWFTVVLHWSLFLGGLGVAAIARRSDLQQRSTHHLGVCVLRLTAAASVMLGFAVRQAGAVRALFTLSPRIALYNDPGEWPWTYLGTFCANCMFAARHAARGLGLDVLLHDTAHRRPCRRHTAGSAVCGCLVTFR